MGIYGWLFGYAGLYVVYLVMIVIGFQAWRRSAAFARVATDVRAST